MIVFPLTSSSKMTRILLSEAAVGGNLPMALAVIEPECQTYDGDCESVDRRTPLLAEHSLGSFVRPGVRGYRESGGSWSPRLLIDKLPETSGTTLIYHASDRSAGLALTSEIESLPGGALRIRSTIVNIGAGRYSLEGLEVRIPLSDNMTEILDFTGRHAHEREAQRHEVLDGLWLKEGRTGRPDFNGSTIIVGTPGFGFSHGRVLMVQLAWSGNAVLGVDRDSDTNAGIIAGELLLPGEIILNEGCSYSTPWVVVAASGEGLDGAMDQIHQWERSLPAHPLVQPVTLNVWEAVGFRQDSDKLCHMADLAASVGVERFVLDDGWFHARRDDRAGLGDWWVDSDAWPDGLHPLVDHVHGLGMEFGLWFEPEMVNSDSDTFRAHADWILRAAGDRRPLEWRNQQVMDLTNPETFSHVYESMCRVFDEYPVDAVKWDHNRPLTDAGSKLRGYAPAVHGQTLAYYRLMGLLRSRYPRIQWESCASGGGRIDLGVVERVQRFWASDMTDALERQRIQEWTVQTVAPEYVGAHVSQPVSRQTGRLFSLDFRALTAVFFGFGVEWDITQASTEDLDRLRDWVGWYKGNRGFLHTGRFFRCDSADPMVRGYGVVARNGSGALLVHMQCGESTSNRGVSLRVPGLPGNALYAVEWDGFRSDAGWMEDFDLAGPTHGVPMSGWMLAHEGVRFARRRPGNGGIVRISRI